MTGNCSSSLDDRDRTILFGDGRIEPGDAVIHFEHGLARYGGQERVKLGDTAQTLTTFIYRHGGKLLLPAEQGRDFWAFGAPADDVTLDRLKAGDWEVRRDEMISELRAGAEYLLAEDRARRAHPAKPLVPEDRSYAEVAARFEYVPTPDQSRAIETILNDLMQDKPMNRLLIGDVGFGKTEIAIRAAAAAALSGHQVILAVPTTVLARQHTDTMRDRFAGIEGVKVVEVSRLVEGKERAASLLSISSGEARIIVGTQALLAEDVVFAEPALIIIDEEQKFGVDDKQALRTLAPGLHILSMTATPIPRSLAAAEVGLLDVSVLATAPGERQPVETVIVSPEKDRLREAITREVERGGQCFIVCPQIADLDTIKTMLSGLSGFEYLMAHGQMPADALEEEMMRFMAGEVDVLLSTAIIESGLDNARANTMVVWNADGFGLSQLHQLRGRVGRGRVSARMILMTEADTADPEDQAAARLSVFADMTDIGSGFEIARKDRDIRGFGQLDGTEQSGELSRLGIGLYRHVLKEYLVSERQKDQDAV